MDDRRLTPEDLKRIEYSHLSDGEISLLISELRASWERERRLREALEKIKKHAVSRRSEAALNTNGPGAPVPSVTPYATTEREAFCYWRGVHQGLDLITPIAHDALKGPP